MSESEGIALGPMTEPPGVGRAIVLNGGSSSGKSTIGRALQSRLDGVWLLIGIDVLIWLLPAELIESPSGFSVVDSEICRGAAFRGVYEGFQHSVGALCRTGQNVIIDDVLVDGGADQRQWEAALTGIGTVWIGVRCDREVAVMRESERGDRPIGIAGRYTDCVHQDVTYDIEVDTSEAPVETTVHMIAVALERLGIAPRSEERARDALPPRSALGPDGSRSLAPWER